MSKEFLGVRDDFGVIRPYPPRGTWVERARCRRYDPEMFYDGRSRGAEVRLICADCPVQVECLDYAIACESLDPYGGHGIWAGLTGKERNRLRNHLSTIHNPLTQQEPA